MTSRFPISFLRCAFALAASACIADPAIISSSSPAGTSAAAWERERYPIGNGRLGAMLSGGIEQELVQFNVDSLWTGSENYSGASGANESAATDATLGDYQNFGELAISIVPSTTTSSAHYTRRLDLSSALFSVDTGNVRREAFASAVDDALFYRIESAAPFELSLSLSGAHGEQTTRTDGGALTFSGTLPNRLAYTARADVVRESPSAATVILRAKTSYDITRADFGRTGSVEPFGAPPSTSYAQAKAAHIADYRKYYATAELHLPPEYEAIERMFNFGRYLLISSSRPGTLPANLQGVWNNSNSPAWHSDWHTNINFQMNYWAVDSANLSPLFAPVSAYLARIASVAAHETRLAFPHSQGVAYRTSLNAFGGGGWKWNFAGAPWLAAMAFDHYLFTQDIPYLRTLAYPLLKDAALFMFSHLVEGPGGELLVRDGWSPEHGPVADGVMHDQQLMAELLGAIVRAQEILQNDPSTAARARETLSRLGGNKIGSWGQLQEWQADIDIKHDTHRHTSHLFAVYPGTTITLSQTPALAAAARVSLETGRTTTADSRRSWTWPWRAALWARLGDGTKALEMLQGLVEYNTLPNCFATHPPFQIDGNLGFPAAVCEMLVQSHETDPSGRTIVRILPALPPAWKYGSVRGLRVRGNATVDIQWAAGEPVRYRLHAADPSRFSVVEPLSPAAVSGVSHSTAIRECQDP